MNFFDLIRPVVTIVPSIALAVVFAGASLTPVKGIAAVPKQPVAVELKPLPEPIRHTVRTKAGTEVAVWLWPGREWIGSADWGADQDGSIKAPTSDVVLIVFDVGDSVGPTKASTVSAEPLVQVLLAMGATVIAFDDPGLDFDHPIAGFDHPIAGFDHPIAGFDHPIAGFDHPIAGRGGDGAARVAAPESAKSVLHAMITWGYGQTITKGRGGRLHLFGVGRGADLALEVGGRRTSELHSILVDGGSDAALARAADLPVGDVENNLEVFNGVKVVRSTSKSARKVARGSVSLAPDSMTHPPAVTMKALAEDGRYQRAVASVVLGP